MQVKFILTAGAMLLDCRFIEVSSCKLPQRRSHLPPRRIASYVSAVAPSIEKMISEVPASMQAWITSSFSSCPFVQKEVNGTLYSPVTRKKSENCLFMSGSVAQLRYRNLVLG